MTDNKATRQAQDRRSYWERMAAWVGLIAAGTSIALAVPFVTDQLILSRPEIDRSAILENLVEVRTQQLRREVDQLKRDRDALLARSSAGGDAVQARQLLQRLQGVEERQVRIERTILGDPQKALELPLLRRDLESLKEANAIGLTSVQQSVDQVYDLSKWLLGALVVGIFSLALSNFLTRKP